MRSTSLVVELVVCAGLGLAVPASAQLPPPITGTVPSSAREPDLAARRVGPVSGPAGASPTRARGGTGVIAPTWIEANCVTAFGGFALASNTTGCGNTAIGRVALYSNTTGDLNTASGDSALYFNSTGSQNTAAGFVALNANTTGSRNTATGASALYLNTTGHRNTGSGSGALYSNTTGSTNTATGDSALPYNTTGYDNSAHGVDALYWNTAGYRNTADGVAALGYNTTGFQNTAAGRWALLGNTEGSYNTGLGHNAGANATTGSFNVYVGAEVTGEESDANTMRLGLAYDGESGQNRTFIAGIYGTEITGGVPVVIGANGQLGVPAPHPPGDVTPVGAAAPGMTPAEREQFAALTARVEAQQATIAALQVALAELRASNRGRKATSLAAPGPPSAPALREPSRRLTTAP
jgi:hypothetical protein